MARLMLRRRGAAWQTALGLAALGTVAALTGAFLVGPMLKVKPPKPATKLAKAHAAAPGAAMDEDSGDEQTAPKARSAARSKQDDDDDADSKPARKKEAAQKSDADRERPSADADSADDDSGSAPAPTARRRHSDSTDESSDSSAKASETRAPRKSAGDEDNPHARSVKRSRPEVSLREVDHAPHADNPHAVAARDASGSEDTGEERPAGAAPALYRIRVGRYHSKDQADEIRARLTARGIPASVVQHGTNYTVQAGSYRLKENAERVAATLRQQDLRPEVSYR
jgi:cell division protein FtsN